MDVARIFLSRRNFSEGGCSMRITEDVRKYAAEQKLSEDEALRAGMEQKAREFTEAGAEIYSKA
jgi:phosphomethylpyrimidine synthase